MTPILIVSLLSLSVAATANAGRYEILRGKGVEVCEAYKSNLESFNFNYPMVCERKVNPAFKDFEKPVWEAVPVEGAGYELLRRVLRYQGWERNQYQESVYRDSDLDGYIKRNQRENIPLIGRTHVDIDNDGQTDEVLIHHDGSCPDTTVSYFVTGLFMIRTGQTSEGAAIDSENRAEKLLRDRISPGLGHFTAVDLFRFMNKTYVDKYCALKNRFTGCDDVDILQVFIINKDAADEICRYKCNR